MKLFFVIKEFGLRLSRVGPLLGGGVSAHASIIPFASPVIQAAASGDQRGVPDLPELAMEHVREILRHPITEPCVVAGYCAEGLLAFEVARQLESMGTRVEAVFLLDTMMFPARSGWRSRWFWRWTWARDNIRFTLQGGPRYLQLKLKGVLLRKRLREAPNSIPLPRPMLENEDIVSEMVRAALVGNILRQARRNYHPQPINSRGVLFRSQDFPELGHDHDREIKRLFRGGLEVVRLAGGHSAVLFDPKSLASHFDHYLGTVAHASRVATVATSCERPGMEVSR